MVFKDMDGDAKDLYYSTSGPKGDGMSYTLI